MAINEQSTITTVINGEQAKNELSILAARAKSYREEMARANAESKKVEEGSKAWKDLEKQYKTAERNLKQTNTEMRKLSRESFDLKKVLDDLSGATLAELDKAQRTIMQNMRQSHVKRGTKEWEEYKKQLQDVKRAQKEVKDELTGGMSGWEKLSFNLKRASGLLIGFGASLVGLNAVMNRSSEEAFKMSDAYANVQKYTGESTEGVNELNEELKKMDTRTSRQELNRLLEEAGKLGIKGKEALLEFVRAADVIQVALGEDLGEDAVKNIGKLSDMFGVTEQLGLEKGMLATASAINEVAQNSTAAEPYLLNFTNRLSGMGKAAGLTIPEIIGFGAVLDQNGQQVEMASTALNKFLGTLATKSEDVAKAVGLPAEEMARAVREDMNEALIMVFRELNRKGGLVDLAPLFKDLGAEGARAGSIITILADNYINLIKEQELANQAFEQGTSVIAEFNTQNNTQQAQLDKSKKRLADATEELGSRFVPAVISATNVNTAFVKALVSTIKWIGENKGMLITLIATISAYTIAVNASVGADKLKVFWTDKLGKSLKSLWTTMKANPYAALGVAIVGVITILYKFITAQTTAQKAMSDFNRETLKQQTEVNRLFDAVKRSNEGSELRAKLIQRINEQYGKYLPNLLTEKSTLEEIKTAQKAVNAALRERIAIQTRDTAKSEAIEKSINKQVKSLDNLRSMVLKKSTEEVTNMLMAEVKEIVDNNNKDYQKAYEEIEKLFIDQGIIQKDVLSSGGDTNVTLLYLSTYFSRLRDLDKELDDIDSKFIGIISKAEQIDGLDEDSNDSGTEPKEGDEKIIDGKIMVYQGGKWVVKKIDPTPSNNYDDELKRLEKEQKEMELFLGEMYRRRLIDENLYQELSTANEIAFLNGKVKLQQQYGKEVLDTEIKLSATRLKQQQQDVKKGEKLQKALNDLQNIKLPEISEEYEEVNADELSLALRFQLLEEFHKRGIKSEAEYQKELAKLIVENRGEINKMVRDSELMGNQERYEKGEIGEKEYLEKNRSIRKAYWDEVFAGETQLANDIQEIASATGQLVSNLQDTALLAVENRYAAELKAAEGNQEKTAKVQEKIEEEKKQVKKKYADIDFGVTAAQIIASTALAVMRAWSDLGPIAGPITAGIVGAAGVAQLALANEQRNQVKNMWTGGYTPDVGKYTPTAIVHGKEFVGSTPTVENPTIRRVYDLVDHAQKTNTVARIDADAIAQAIGVRRSLAAGGYAASVASPATNQGNSINTYELQQINKTMRQTAAINAALLQELQGGIYAQVSVSGRNGTSEMTKKYNNYVSNASRN